MTSPIHEFRQHSEDVVGKFLQTIVVVDDRAFFQRTESSTKPTTLKASPVRPRFTGAPQAVAEHRDETTDVVGPAKDSSGAEVGSLVEDATTAEETSEDLAHELNAKYLIESFAGRGIVCAVLRPSEIEVAQLDKKVYPIAERADIVMLDWVLHEDTEGRKVKELIAEMTKTSSAQHRVRLIVVYTGELVLSDIIDEIQRTLQDSDVTDVLKKDDFTLTTGAVRITIYAKNNVRRAESGGELRERMIPVDQLPDRLIREFADMTAGLVSNVALGSFAALRSNTHRVLSKFSSGIDAPFLAHRAMLERPEDANDLLVYLVGAELTAILEGNEVGKIADKIEASDVIRAWLDMCEAKIQDAGGRGLAHKFSVKSSPEFLDDLCKMLRKGVADSTLTDELKKLNEDEEPHKKKLTEKLSIDKRSAGSMENKFAVLTTLKSDYRVNPPSLLPGTLLKESPSESGAKPRPKYWVCIQPICDCVRIRGERSFPFLEMVEDNGRFNLVLPDDEKEFVKARIIFRPHKLRMMEFKATDHGMVRGVREGEAVFFKAERSENKYRWIGELKFEQAQRIVNKYAAEISRVGLDESEWLRRWAL
jgi:Response receiver domain